MQTIIYYAHYKHDPTWMKVAISVISVFSALHTAVNAQWAYDALVIHWGQTDLLLRANWNVAAGSSLNGIVAMFCQLWFGYRIRVLTDNRWIALVVAILAVTSFLGSVGTSLAPIWIPEILDFTKFKSIVVVWLACAALCDVTVTVVLSICLRNHKTGIRASDNLINRITLMTIQNGLLTTIWAILNLLFFLIVKSGLHLAINIPLADLYFLTLLTTLNARKHLRSKYGGNDTSDLPTMSGHDGQRRDTNILAFASHAESIAIDNDEDAVSLKNRRNLTGLEPEWSETQQSLSTLATDKNSRRASMPDL
ncbi:hypothetical protein PUNSTDRAFT_142680 [Punctularia strigosozonata HHB-11173 SS5]|uniref:uncharacterized protein n=1 Tax=Punctularia strigosozonata (strain HHB-11173) TaxID=741275 RepID=UPI0004416EB9|nr:uncharacterized protein PUNSTDRAFT_142680 [Punctularia strigosozonata HHB-11173 SS5]EIN10734.1 hypothetical protein PUNSTDRAFT_142680 [Punctularia strigosozonata HHB-11173 SS5]